MQELSIIQKAYDLIRWYVPILNRLPSDHKLALGDRIISRLYDANQQSYKRGAIGAEEVRQSIRSWIAHLEHGDTWRLREKIFTALVFARG